MSTENIVPEKATIYRQAFDKMIATNQDSYKTNYGNSNLSRNYFKEYTDQEIADIISSGDLDSMRGLSRAYYYSSGYYRRLVLYYAYLLSYAYVVIPHFKKKINNQSKTNYYQALSFCDEIKIKTFSQHVALNTMIDGCYFGLLVEQNGQYSTMDLPFGYCRTRFKGLNGLSIVELNLNYFSGLTDDASRERAFQVYPREVKRAYLKFKSGNSTNINDRWYAFDEGVGIYFAMDEARPMFINTIPTIETFQTYKGLELKKQELETKKILVQQLGMNKEGEFLIEPDEGVTMHDGAVKMLQNNRDIDVLTTYAEVDVKSLSDSRQTVTSNLSTFLNFIYDEAGVSSSIFNANGNLSLDQSLKNDLSLMMVLAEKLSTYYSFITTNIVGNSSISYRVSILPVSVYNTQEYIDNTYKLATAGYSFLLPALASGLTQQEAVDIKILENELLELENLFEPLKLSSTQTGDEEGGAPTKKNEKKADKTIKNQNGEGE